MSMTNVLTWDLSSLSPFSTLKAAAEDHGVRDYELVLALVLTDDKRQIFLAEQLKAALSEDLAQRGIRVDGAFGVRVPPEPLREKREGEGR